MENVKIYGYFVYVSQLQTFWTIPGALVYLIFNNHHTKLFLKTHNGLCLGSFKNFNITLLTNKIYQIITLMRLIIFS